MYLLLLVFGGLLGAAGVLLALAGMAPRDGTFDPAILTPGIVAAAGGLLLIGLGAGLRTLQRIERTLASRPMPRALTNAESAKPSESAETPGDPAHIPFVPKATADAQPAVASSDIFGVKPSETVSDKLSPAVIAVAAVHDANAETRAQASGKNGNGAGGMQSFRLPSRLRPASAGERQGEPIFDALWPKGPRPARTVEGASVPLTQGAGVTARESQNTADGSNLSPSNPGNVTAAMSVLKSGVVNGMPYTLYADGSIEAQLPDGTLRFGSITELRNHIEQSA
jgi:hypothetical protein